MVQNYRKCLHGNQIEARVEFLGFDTFSTCVEFLGFDTFSTCFVFEGICRIIILKYYPSGFSKG